MLTFPSAFQAHLEGSAPTLSYCFQITRRDGVIVRGTSHDVDVVIATGTYAGVYSRRSAAFATQVAQKSDGAVTNVDLDGAIRVDALDDEFSVADLESGVYDQAEAVLLKLNWQDPDQGQKVVVGGWLGEFERDTSNRWRTEVRGLTYILQQNFTRSYSERCDARFGDTRCGFDLSSVQRTCTVTSVTDRRRFTATLDTGPAPAGQAYYFGGIVTGTSGDNDGFSREVRVHNVPGATIDILLYDELPADFEVGDTFTLDAACDKLYGSCLFLHENLDNFRGHGLFATGRDRLMRDPKSVVASTFDAGDGNLISESEYDASRAALQQLGLTIMGLA